MAEKGVLLGKKTAQQVVDFLRNQNGSGRSGEFRDDPTPLIFRNDSGEEVPAYACMKVTDAVEVDGRWIMVITKPDGNGGPFLFNGARAVEKGKRGSAQWGPIVRAYYTTGTPAVAEAWGVSSDWFVSVGGTDAAVTVFGDVDTNVLMGTQLSPAKSSKLIVAPSGGIPPRVNYTLGSAACDVWADDGNGTETVADTGENITVYNWATSAVLANGDRFGVAVWNGSMWLAISDDCNDEGVTVQADPGTTGGTATGGGGGTVGWPLDDPYLDITPSAAVASDGADIIGDVDAGKIPPPP